MSAVDIFILSLPNEKERRRSSAAECARYGLSFMWVDAMDYREKSTADIVSCYEPTTRAINKNRYLSPAEIVCALGHQRIYQYVIEQQLSYAVVLEDDFKWQADPRLLFAHLDEIAVHTQFDVLLLGYVKILPEDLPYHCQRLPLQHQYRCANYVFGQPWQQFSCGTVAYVVSLAGAKKLLQKKIHVTADDWLYFEQSRQVVVMHVRPLLALEKTKEFVSSIRKEKVDYLHIKKSSRCIRCIKGMIKNFVMNQLGYRP
jgi:hypothetical protein